HHKHGAYIIRNAHLPAFAADEIELIATLVRYHRKSLPKPAHPEWAQADAVTRAKIEGLGAMLRIADGLDARHLAVVESVEIVRSAVAVELVVAAQQDIGSEVAAASGKSDLFTRAFGLPLIVRAAPQERYAEIDTDARAEEMSPASRTG
ncbi:MAG TPA: hypothetical protein VGD50_02430, partial [Candidatus Baltobacteraceae bacterium]